MEVTKMYKTEILLPENPNSAFPTLPTSRVLPEGLAVLCVPGPLEPETSSLATPRPLVLDGQLGTRAADWGSGGPLRDALG